MKRFLFIFLLICPLWLCTSCWKDDDEEKITGTQPEILIGKWERYGTGSFFFDSWKYYERYEIRKDGGLVIWRSYDKATQTYLEPDTTYHFSNWLYSEEKQLIYFNISSSKTRCDRRYSMRELTSDSVKIAGLEYYKIEE